MTTMTKTKTKICLSCASKNKFRWLPCVDHTVLADRATCQHESTSFIIHANANKDCNAMSCHDCGLYTDNCEGN